MSTAVTVTFYMYFGVQIPSPQSHFERIRTSINKQKITTKSEIPNPYQNKGSETHLLIWPRKFTRRYHL